MEFEQQKPITDDYRNNWERIYGTAGVRRPLGMVTDWGMGYAHPDPVGNVDMKFLEPSPEARVCSFEPIEDLYPNGCPVLSDENS